MCKEFSLAPSTVQGTEHNEWRCTRVACLANVANCDETFDVRMFHLEVSNHWILMPQI